MILIWFRLPSKKISVALIKLSCSIQTLATRRVCHSVVNSLINLLWLFVQRLCVKPSSISSWAYLAWDLLLKLKSLFLFLDHLIDLVLLEILHQNLVLSTELLVVIHFILVVFLSIFGLLCLTLIFSIIHLLLSLLPNFHLVFKPSSCHSLEVLMLPFSWEPLCLIARRKTVRVDCLIWHLRIVVWVQGRVCLFASSL